MTSSKQVDLSVGNVEATAQHPAIAGKADDPKEHTLDDMFSSWVRIYSGWWNSAAQPPYKGERELDHSLVTLNVPEVIVQDDLVQKKLAHHRFLKCDVEIELKVNALPTQSGLLFMTCLPLMCTGSTDQPYVRPEEADTGLAGITGIPGVYLNIEDSSSVKLNIPYIHPFTMFDMKSQYQQTLGSVAVYPIAPLLGPTTSEKVHFSVYGRLTNVRLFGPCENPTPTLQPSLSSLLECEIGKENNGWKVSDIANTVSNVAGALTAVPVIGEVAGAVSWFGRMVGTAAAAIGFSKPNLQAAPNFVMRMATYGLQFVQGYVPSISLGAVQDNEIANDLIGEDEMSIAFLARQEAVLESYPLGLDSAANNPDKVLSTFFVTPVNNALVGDQSVYHTPLSWAASYFQYWRGSLTYRFRFIKTKFHKGRLRVTFEPGNFSLTANAPKYNRCYTTLVDLASTSEVTFTVPYISSKEWLETSLVDVDGTVAWWDNNCTGRVTLSVVNPIIAPESVSRYITIVTSMYSEDMQVANPMANVESTIVSSAPLGEIPEILECEVGETVNPIQVKPDHTISKYTMGESIGNMRLITRKMTAFTTLEKDIIPTQKCVYSSFCADAYALWRGSIRVGVHLTPGTQFKRVAVGLNRADKTYYNSDLVHPNILTSDFNQFTLPFYSDLRTQLVVSRSPQTNYSNRSKYSFVRCTPLAKGSTVYMAAGDDFTYLLRRPLASRHINAIK